MTPLNAAVQELRLVRFQAQVKAAGYLPEALGRRPTAGELEDHRTEVLAELLDALDRIDPRVGQDILAAMYPLTAAGAAA